MKNKIESFKDACKVLGIDTNVPDFSKFPKKHQKALTAHYKLVIIAEALNDGWEPDWGNWDEWKHYPWFAFEKGRDKSSGFGFSFGDWTVSNAYTGVGARLCFKTEELAEYAGKQFENLYRDYFLLE